MSNAIHGTQPSLHGNSFPDITSSPVSQCGASSNLPPILSLPRPPPPSKITMAYEFKEVSCSTSDPLTALNTLSMDYAIVRFSPPPSTLSAYSVSSHYTDCYECPPSLLLKRSAYLSEPTCFQIPVNYETELTFGGPLCAAKISPYVIKPKQFTYHDLTITTNSVGDCSVEFTHIESETLSSGVIPLITLSFYLLSISAFRWLWVKSKKRDVAELLKSEIMDPMLGDEGGVNVGGGKDELLSPLISDLDR